MSSSVRDIRAKVYLNTKQAGGSLRELQGQARKVRNELMRMDTNADGYGAKVKKFRALNAQVTAHKKEIYGVNRSWSGAVDTFNKYAGVLLAGTAALGGAVFTFKELVNAHADFEKSLTNVYTLLDKETFDRYHKELERGAKEVMKEYGFAQEDVNKALFDAISAGVPAGKAIEFLHESAILAVGGVTSLAVSTDGLTSILNAYKLEIGETENVAAAFFSAQKEGKTTVEQLATTIGKAAPIAANLGISYQELLSSIATLTKGGISTAESVTYLRGAMVALQKPTTATTKLFKEEFGHGLGVSEIKARGFGTVVDELNQLMAKYPDEIAKAIPNIRAFTGITALSGEGLEEYNRILQLVQNDIGKTNSLTDAFARQQETSAQYMARAKAEIETYRIELGERLQPLMGAMIFKFSKLLKLLVALPEWWKENKELVLLLGGAIALYNQKLLLATASKWRLIAAEKAAITQQKLGALWTSAQVTAQALYITGSNLLTGKIKLATAAQRAFNIALSANPIGLVVGSLMLLVGALKLYDTYSDRSVKLNEQEREIKKELKAVNELVSETQEQVNILTRNYAEASNEERKAIRETIKTKQLELKTRLANLKAKRDELAETASELTGWQKLKNGVLGAIPFLHQFGGAMGVVKDSIANSKEATSEHDQAILTLENNLKELAEGLTGLGEKEKQIQQQRAQAAKDYAKERLNAEQKIKEFLEGFTDTEIDRERKKFEKMLALAEEYGLDRQELEARMQEELRTKQLEQEQEQREAEQERQMQLMENSMQQLWEYEQGILMEQDEWRLMNKEEQDAAMLDLEIQHLERLLEARKAMGEDTLAVEKKLTAAKTEATEIRTKGSAAETEMQMKSAAAAAFNAGAQADGAREAKRAVLNSIRAQIQAQIAKAIAEMLSKLIGSTGPLGLVAAPALAATAGAIFNNLIPSFDSGGYTGTGLGTPDPKVPGRQIAGVVHDGEYVVATEELMQPDIANMVQTIETRRVARVSGDFTTPNVPDGSYVTGGLVTALASRKNTKENNSSLRVLKNIEQAIMLIVDERHKPRIAVVPDDTRNKMNDKTALENLVRSQKKING